MTLGHWFVLIGFIAGVLVASGGSYWVYQAGRKRGTVEGWRRALREERIRREQEFEADNTGVLPLGTKSLGLRTERTRKQRRNRRKTWTQ